MTVSQYLGRSMFCLFSFLLLLPLPSPMPKEESRQCFSQLSAIPTGSRHRWGWLPPSSTLGCPASAAFLLPRGRCDLGGRGETPARRGSADHGFSLAARQGRTRSCRWEGGTAPCRQGSLACLWQSKPFQWQHAGTSWVGSDAESCREIRDKQLTLTHLLPDFP